MTLEDGLKGRNQTATTKILTHTATYKEHGPSTTALDAKIKMQTRTGVQGQANASLTYHVPHNSFHRRHDI